MGGTEIGDGEVGVKDCRQMGAVAAVCCSVGCVQYCTSSLSVVVEGSWVCVDGIRVLYNSVRYRAVLEIEYGAQCCTVVEREREIESERERERERDFERCCGGHSIPRESVVL